jgi:Glycosyltransferase family 92
MLTDLSYSHYYIGKLSIVSQSGDGIEMVRSLGGLSFNEYAVQIMQINMCLHHSRGLAEFVYMSDLQEFFIPQGKNRNFFDVFKSIEPQTDLSIYSEIDNKVIDIWRDKKTADSGHGWAAKNAHPFCYISVDSEYVVDAKRGVYTDSDHPWVGQR